MVPRNSLSKRVLRQARARARIPSALDIAGVRCQDDDLRFAKFAKNRDHRFPVHVAHLEVHQCGSSVVFCIPISDSKTFASADFGVTSVGMAVAAQRACELSSRICGMAFVSH